MTDAARTPVVVATGQVVEHDEIVDARTLAIRAARVALDDAGSVAARLQRVTMLSTLVSPGGPSIAREVAAGVGLHGVHAETTTVGGNMPPWLVTRAAEEIARGELDATLVVGAEAARSWRVGGDGSGALFTAKADPMAGTDPVVGAGEKGYVSRAEVWAGLVYPTTVYPLFESVLAARAGRSFAEQRAFVARFMARFTDVAADHPCAWFRTRRSAAELASPSGDNRLVAEPYPKLVNAFPFVDQAAAVVVCSLAVAQDAGVADRAVFVWSGADACEVRLPTARPDLGTSAGVRAAASRSFSAAGVGVDDVGSFDLYSCFPSAVELGADAVGVALDDPRGLTVTGGLPYFGGPGNNYATHSIATMVGVLRERGGLGLCSGIGGYMTRHGVTVLGATPPPAGFARGDTADDQARIDASAREVAVDDAIDGVASVVAGTVVYAADGSVEAAPVVADLDDGRRVAALADATLLPDLAGVLLVGDRVRVRGKPPTWTFAR